jgi:hypothetical protein
VARGDLPAGWAVDDGAALLVRGERVTRVVSSRPAAGAVRVHAADGIVTSTEEPADLLAGRPDPGAADPAIAELRAMRGAQRAGRG